MENLSMYNKMYNEELIIDVRSGKAVCLVNAIQGSLPPTRRDM